MGSKSGQLKKNAVFGFGIQLIIMLAGIVIPRIMIGSYGSDVNGLLNTIAQIFSYMALFEAGISQAARNALYKPLVEKDHDEVSHIASMAMNYFKKVTVFYAIAVIALAALCPFIIKTSVNATTVFLVVLFEGMTGVVNFCFLETKRTVLRSDGRGYINQSFSAVSTAAGYAAKIILAAYGISIIVLQIVYFLFSVLNVFFYKIYFKKHYGWIRFNKAEKGEKLAHRGSYLVTEIAGIAFSSTDAVVISVFISTALASVYSIYNLVISSINGLLNVVYMNTLYVLGKAFQRDRQEYIKIHDAYTTVFFGTMTILMCTAYILYIPFIRLYTTGVTDVEYIYKELPLFFCLIQVLSWSRYVTGNLSGIAGYAKQAGRVSIIEAIVNIVLSVILVNIYGIVGVLIATVLALPIKVVYLTWLSEKKILKRSPKKYLGILGANYMLFVVTVIIEKLLHIQFDDYIQFFIGGFITVIICAVVGIAVNLLANPQCISYVKNIVCRQRQ